ncbi:hypothetical protein EsHS_00007026 [Epichloe bromicola]
MTDTEFELLEPFGIKPKEKWFRTAYKWKRDKIFEWMETTAKAGGVPPGGVPPGGGSVAGDLLEEVYKYIKDLSLPEGALYKDNTRKPFSHIARLLNDKFKQESETEGETSKFFVNGWTIVPSIDPSMMEEKKPGKKPGWWCPYDLLGLFLSLLGPAPAAADKNNFYLPLTAVYARWCSRIAGRPDEKWKWEPSDHGEGPLPYVFQCTWHTTVDEKTKQHCGQYFLGASTAGDEFRIETGSWREEVQEARFNMLFACQKVSMVQENDFREKKAPNMNRPAGTQVPFGNCAETYPFAIRFSGDMTQNKNSMAGLALKRDFMEKEYPDYDEHKNNKDKAPAKHKTVPK